MIPYLFNDYSSVARSRQGCYSPVLPVKSSGKVEKVVSLEVDSILVQHFILE
jgi:hypothetical protein